MGFEVEGLAVRARLSPMSWAHPDEKLQMEFELGPGLGTELQVYQKPFTGCSLLDLQLLVETVHRRLSAGGLVPCPECGTLTWNRAVFPSSTRDARCEHCWMGDWRATWAGYTDAALVEQFVDDLAMARKGFTHCFDGWVHPSRGPKRLLRVFLRGEMSDADAAALLKQQGCKVCNDYRVRVLPPSLSFADAKATADFLDAEAGAAAALLASFGKRRVDSERASPDYWAARAAFELAVVKRRIYGRWYARTFKVQRQMERLLRPVKAQG